MPLMNFRIDPLMSTRSTSDRGQVYGPGDFVIHEASVGDSRAAMFFNHRGGLQKIVRVPKPLKNWGKLQALMRGMLKNEGLWTRSTRTRGK